MGVIDLLVIAFLLSVAMICMDWARIRWHWTYEGKHKRRWYWLALWGFLLGLYNLVYGVMKIWFTIEGMLQ